MISSFQIPIIIGSAVVLLIIVSFGYIAATESDSPRKGKARFIATLAFGFWFCAMGASMMAYEQTRPILEAAGVIDNFRVIHSDSRHYSAYLYIATSSGGIISLHTSDRSIYFHRGEHLWLRYQGDTGELLKAIFYATNGSQEGAFQNTQVLGEVGSILGGSLLIWAAFKKYRRDPEGSES